MADGAAFIPALARGAALAALLATLAGCAAGPAADRGDAAPPSEVAGAICAQHRPRDQAGCAQVRLPDRASEIAYRTCLEYNRTAPQRCKNLRLAFEADLRAYLAPRPAVPDRRSAAAPEPASPELAQEETPVLYHTAQQLYDATSSDAQTFSAALLISEIRQRIELALHRQLSDDELRKLASHARAEALYWYEYMKGLEETERRSN